MSEAKDLANEEEMEAIHGEAMTDMEAKAREYLQKPYRGPKEAFIAGYRAGYEEHREQTKGNFAALTTTAIGEFKTKHFNAGMEEAAKEFSKFVDEVTGFCVALRQDHPCWESHKDAGVLFAKAAAIREKIKTKGVTP